MNNLEEKIQLLNGNILQCYTAQRVANQKIDNSLQLDTTGEYLTIGNRKPKPSKQPVESKEEKVFIQNAFFFLTCSREIMNDSRMFLAYVPIQSGLAYTGISGFKHPTLGVYLEWWAACSQSVIEEEGMKWLVYHLAGSPLSGCNKCGLVNEAGETKCITLPDFHALWSSFIKINSRYDEAKEKYMAFTLSETLNLLNKQNRDEEKLSFALDCFFFRSQIQLLTERYEKKNAEADKLRKELTETRIQLHEQTLKEIYDEYWQWCRQRMKRADELRSARIKWRKMLKSGELTNYEYQQIIVPLNKELQSLTYPSDPDFVKKVYEYGLTIYDVEKYFRAKEQQRGDENTKD